jgi:hypothetical protein
MSLPPRIVTFCPHCWRYWRCERRRALGQATYVRLYCDRHLDAMRQRAAVRVAVF